jgi:hypothetical protein
MRVLLLHAEDVPWRGPWASVRWDHIIDLAYAGPDIYAGWRLRCGSPVRSIHEFAGDGESYASVKALLNPGRNHLVDRMGLDWWEIIAVLSHHELQALYLVQQLRRELGNNVEYHVTRPGTFGNLLGQMIGSAVPAYEAAPTRIEALALSLRSARELRPEQVTEIALDKWDASYSLRRLLAKSRRANCEEPVILLPSAYSNVTRILLAYARDLPQRNFLLASTRRSGSSKNLPGNVVSTSLAAYAQPPAASERELHELVDRWSWFERQILVQCDALRPARDAGVWRDFPAHLRRGIRLRNAWHELMKAEPVSAVFCGDDLNYYTRIPLMLARNMGLNAVYCCHGALDGGMLFKQPYANRYLVKGEMEKDYLLRCSTIDPDLVEIGAPSSYAPRTEKRAEVRAQDIVFFSQPYEVLAGRTAEIYRELLPRLCAVARRTGRKVTLKLHPFESLRDRKRLLNSVLSEAEISLVQVVAQQPLAELLTHAWFGIGVDSSVAVECALAGVPYFLCGWLDHSGFGYGQQLARYRVGRMLHAASEIEAIPDLIGNWTRPELTRVSKSVDKDVLDGMLFAHNKVSLAC